MTTSFLLHEICRHRMGTDGPGINSLAALAGCPASCRYCLNEEVLKKDNAKKITPEQLLEKVSLDTCYMMATGGGVTFGGGEPLLQSSAILKFARIRPEWMKINIETSLQVPEAHVTELIPYVSLWIIDLKAEDPEVYKAYTGLTTEARDHNLQILRERVPDKCFLRVPEIPGYVTEEAADAFADRLRQDGYRSVERFTYKINI